ncbi:hypothetical protein M622_03145 [Thauera terpenica 58Eu]|uniref:Uncharacterized protein n=1 Tax=Thauera terpenica 58Eu TaxID=1348657 RepID=T0B051_9RHOO|nr:hypothetical protein M622_03145 [Thauera terpenica 58Eu]
MRRQRRPSPCSSSQHHPPAFADSVFEICAEAAPANEINIDIRY